MNKWTTHTAEYEDTLQRVSVIAEKSGYILNPNGERVKKVVGLMTENFVQTGKYFCPCKQSHPLNPEVDVLCPCPTWKEEIKEVGHCFCDLFYQKVDSRE